MKLRIYTYVYNSFTLGGNCNQYTGTEIDMQNPPDSVSLGYGYMAYLIRNPIRHCWHAIESESGAIIGTGHSRAEVRRKILHDAKTGDPTIMASQIETEKEIAKGSPIIPSKEFFDHFHNFKRSA